VNEPIIPLIYPKGYSVQGMDVIGIYGRKLKDSRHGHISLYAKGQKGITASRCKIVWAARHNIDIRKIPKEYSFWLADDGTLQCDTFNARMSMIASVKAKEIKVKREEYEFTEKYAHLALQMLDGDATAKARLFSLINGKRDELISYAHRAKGGVSQEKAELYTDMAIAYTYDLILSGRYYVPSPIGSVKGRINMLIIQNRKKREINRKIEYRYEQDN
jgi:hypothetical protein